MDAELGCKLLLAWSSRNPEKSQDTGIRGRESKNPQSFSKLRGGVRSKLGKQEGRLSLFHGA